MSQQGQWQVAGSAPEVYERDLVPAVFGPWARILIGLAPPKPGDRVIDIACGTGIVARIAEEKHAQLWINHDKPSSGTRRHLPEFYE